LDAHFTNQLLHEAHKAYNTTVQEVLLAAVVGAVLQWSDHSRGRLLIDMEGHGREDGLFDDIDLSRTVGWFTALYPLCLAIDLRTGHGEVLKAVKETLRQVPAHGIGYGALKYLSEPHVAHQLAALTTAELSFNYLGRFDEVLDAQGPFTIASESVGATRNAQGERPHLLDFSADITRGRLTVRCNYSKLLHHSEHIQSLLHLLNHRLVELIEHCLQPNVGDYTPSDFPLADLSSDELESVLGGVEFESTDDAT
jgi:non-ribosomal peptide synthase protein (TIGR01720 family)